MSWFQSLFPQRGSVTINGVEYQGKNISIRDGSVFVDGEVQSLISAQQITVSVQGAVNHVSTTSGDITVVGDVKGVETTSGDIDCNHVLGNVTTVSGNVVCNDIAGRVSTVSGNIRQR